jgi:serine/threonine protein kinase
MRLYKRHDPDAPAIGTPYFSAPECFHKGASISSKADIWSAGAILYFMTYGQPPLEESAHAPRGMSPTRSPNVDDVLRHCLQQSPHHRRSHSWLAQHPYTVNPSVL